MDLIPESISVVEGLSIVLVLAMLFIIYRYTGLFGVYKVSKPHAWLEAVRQDRISAELKAVEKKYSDKVRFYNLWFQCERLKKKGIPGSYAELGVYKGQTARAMHWMDQDRVFYLFDTFEGFNKEDLANEDYRDEHVSVEMFADTGVRQVKDYINGNDNLRFCVGYFPATTLGLENESFALVNIDADLYAPTIQALNFFYPRVSPGGVIIVHDYNHYWDGVTKALDEFMPSIPESLIELSDWQGSAMIIKNSP